MDKTKPLAGIRVLDFGAFIAGPYASSILATLGAEVVKVEPIGEGDAYRRGLGTADPYFVQMNAGKKSISVDLKSPKGIALIKEMLPGFDVVMENSRPGVMERLGLGAEAVRAINPSVVYASVSGFGDGGPWRDRAAFDTIGQTASGFISIMSDEGNPKLAGTCIGDLATGLVSALGIVAGLVGRLRDRNDAGTEIRSSLLEAMTAITIDAMTQGFESGKSPTRESRHPAGQPYCVKTGDGRAITVHTSGSTKFWESLAKVMGRADLIEDPRFRTYADRKENYFELRAVIEAEFLKHDLATWERRLIEADVPHAAVVEALELPEHPQMQWLDMYEPPRADGLRLVRPPWRFEGARGSRPEGAPMPGQNTREEMSKVLPADEVERLIAEGVLFQADQAAG